jgi:hypothetical protein
MNVFYLTRQEWRTANHTELNTGKTEYIAFFRDTNMLAINYVLFKTNVLRYGCIKYIGTFLYCKLHFNQNAVYLLSHAIKLVRPNTEY